MLQAIKNGARAMYRKGVAVVTQTKAQLIGLVTGSTLVVGSAQAAVPASVTSGITEAVADVGIIGAAVLGVVIAIAAFMWLKRPINGH